MLSLPSLLLMRNRELFLEGEWALVNPHDNAIFDELANPMLIGLHQSMDPYQNASKVSKCSHYYNAQFELPSLLDGAVIYLPKAKQHLGVLIDNMHSLIKTGGQLLVVGENKAGIKSVARLLEKLGSTVNKIDNAKHCGLLCVTVETQASAPFDIHKFGIVKTYQVNGVEIKIFSLPGVFGHKQFDPGTQLLLQQFEPKSERLLSLRGRILDFACGTGIIGAYLLKTNRHVKLVMSDVSALATYCAKQTLLLNDITADVIDSDGMSEVQGTFDAVISNPPFHKGIHTNYDISHQFIRQAHKQTKPRGKLWIVANRFLPYADVLQDTYYNSSSMLQTNKFSIYEATK